MMKFDLPLCTASDVERAVRQPACTVDTAPFVWLLLKQDVTRSRTSHMLGFLR